MAVVDGDELLATLVHGAEGRELFAGVDEVAGRGCGVCVRAADDPADDARGSREQAACFTRGRRSRVRDDLVAELPREGEDATLARYAPPAIAGMTITSEPSGTLALVPPLARASSSPMYTFT